MNVFVFGQSGQVASELQRSADVTALGRSEADLSDPDACAAAIRMHRPDAVINAAAYTAVDRAEEEEGLARIINGAAPTEMAKTCAELDIPFVHISTDYVFAGDGVKPWSPSDATVAANAYGRSKLAGETGIRTVGGTYAILRTSWVVSAHGNKFVKTMLRLSETRDHLNIVSDQIGGPTPARDIAEACLSIARQLRADGGKSGTYHFSGAPDVSWHDFAAEIFALASRETSLTPIPTADYPTPAKRPLNSRLDCESTLEVFGISRPDWRVALSEILTEMDQK